MNTFLTSSKTGYGIELVVQNFLSSTYRFEFPMFLIGNCNVGKSSLFNKLLLSDLSKVSARNAIHRLTVSEFPGVTSGISCFPVNRMRPVQKFMRAEYLKEHSDRKLKDLQSSCSNHGYKLLPVSETCISATSSYDVSSYLEKDINKVDAFSYNSVKGMVNDSGDKDNKLNQLTEEIVNYEPLRNDPPRILKSDIHRGKHDSSTRLVYDTVSLTYNQSVLMSCLSPTQYIEVQRSRFDRPVNERPNVTNTDFILPRTFILNKKLSLLLGHFGRIDFLGASEDLEIYATTHTVLPIHIVETEKLISYYEMYGNQLCHCLSSNQSKDILSRFKSKVFEEIPVCDSKNESLFDIILSDAGFVNITTKQKTRRHQSSDVPFISFQVSTPGGVGISLRSPSFTPTAVRRKLARKIYSREYKII